MPWIKRRRKLNFWNSREIKIYVVATIFSAVTALGLSVVVDYGGSIIEKISMIASLEIDADSAKKIKSFLEKNVDAETLELAHEEYGHQEAREVDRVDQAHDQRYEVPFIRYVGTDEDTRPEEEEDAEEEVEVPPLLRLPKTEHP